MYRDLRQHYWKRQMKKDIVEYVARCLNCQQVKYEHQRPDRGPRVTSHFWRVVQSELGTHVELSTEFHSQTDGQSERTVQILEDMLRACVIDIGGQWDQFLPLAEFAYNNNYQSSIEMAPFEDLYDWRCRSPIEWFEPGEAKLYGTDLVKYALEKLDKSLGYEEEPVTIVDRQDCQLRSKRISAVKVQWRGQPLEEATWESEEDMRSRYRHFFGTSGMNLNPFEDERLFKRWRM
ncbi:uncharacterized protein [Nicotiana sylvestris]|uniref:uncharacterized protein n=1 Tax=Nicotiana sylvestris TaxID=4096 RepID=UPI00388C81A7